MPLIVLHMPVCMHTTISVAARSPLSHVPPPQMQAIYLNPELFQPMHIKLESPEAVAQRRSVEMAARRQVAGPTAHASAHASAPASCAAVLLQR